MIYAIVLVKLAREQRAALYEQLLAPRAVVSGSLFAEGCQYDAMFQIRAQNPTDLNRLATDMGNLPGVKVKAINQILEPEMHETL